MDTPAQSPTDPPQSGPLFDLGQFAKKCERVQVIAAYRALAPRLSITERVEVVSEKFGVHSQTVRRHLKAERLIGANAGKPPPEYRKQAAARRVSTSVAQQVVRAVAPLFDPEDAQAIGEGLAAGLVLSSVINTQRERVRDLSKLVKRLSVQVEHVIGPHINAETGQPMPVDPAAVHASARTFASLVAAVSELNAEERRAWGIKEEAGLLSWSETLDQLDKARIVNGQLVSPGGPAAASSDPAPEPATIAGESRRLDPSESGQPE